MHKPAEYRQYNGTVLFFVIDDIKELPPDLAYRCLVQLNKVIGKSKLVRMIGKEWLGTTVSGLFILVPDRYAIVPHTFLPDLFENISAVGIPVRCGVSWGPFLCFEDLDETLNFIGAAINVAARLAYSKENRACLLHDKYEHYVNGFVGRTSADFLRNARIRIIKGKEHDGDGFSCRVLDKTHLTVISKITRQVQRSKCRPIFSSGLILSYDLPKFSEGDEAQLRKRVRSLLDSLRSLRQDNSMFRNAAFHFCPGGDGGILVLADVREEAAAFARELRQKLGVESEQKDSTISVQARIGIHYGGVTLYKDVGGRLRPTGPSCFIADELISDKPSKEAGIVFSDALKAAISHGSSEFLSKEFDELPQLKNGPAAGIARYAPKSGGTLQMKKHPLIAQLFGSASSWQPQVQSK